MVTCAVEFKSWKKIKRRKKNVLTWNKGWSTFKGTLLEWVMVNIWSSSSGVPNSKDQSIDLSYFDILRTEEENMLIRTFKSGAQIILKAMSHTSTALKTKLDKFWQKEFNGFMKFELKPPCPLFWNAKGSRNKVNSTV